MLQTPELEPPVLLRLLDDVQHLLSHQTTNTSPVKTQKNDTTADLSGC